MRYDVQWATAVVRRIRQLTPTVREFELEPSLGAATYTVGSHINVQVLIRDVPETRCYSLVGARPRNGLYRIAVGYQARGRGGSSYMWGLAQGARLAISAPQNFFELSLTAPQYLLVAGGIGITALYGMAERLCLSGISFKLIYAARTRGELAFVDELTAMLGDRLHLAISSEGGRIELAEEFRVLPSDAQVYMCGPLDMLDAARHGWRELGRKPENLRFETFGSSGCFAAVPFEVELRDLGVRVPVPVNRSIIDALQAAGVPMMYDCMRGECGLCVVDVVHVEGTIDHRDVFLSEEQKREGKQICLCVSRAVNGAITIDTGFRPKGHVRGASSYSPV